MNWYTVAQYRFNGISAETFSAELSHFQMVTAAEDKHRLKKLILALLVGGMAGWGLSDLAQEISKQTGLDKSEAVEMVEEVAQESMEARIALQEAEGREVATRETGQDEKPVGTTPSGYDMDAFYATLKDYEGAEDHVYLDDRENPTIGIGHLITPEDGFDENTRLDDPQIKSLFEKDVQHHIARAVRLVPSFSKLPVYLQKEILASVYRGGISGSPKTLRLINAGRWREAAVEFLKNNEYLGRLEAGGDGVTKRMKNLRDAMLRYAKEVE